MEAGMIREYRKKKKMIQNDLAAQMGIKQNVLSNYENGRTSIERMPVGVFMKMVTILEIPDECIYLDSSRELDERLLKLEKQRTKEEETMKKNKRITKYLINLAEAPVSEGGCLAVNRINIGYQAKEMAFLLGLHPSVYNRYENDKRKIPYGIAVKVAYILDKRFEEIFDL